MPAFFTVSGYYAERALERQHAAEFIRKRLLRLGLPFAVVVLVLHPSYFYLNYHLHSGAADVGQISLAHFYTHHWLGLRQPAHFRWPGLKFPLFSKVHVWFLESLLAYSVGLAVLPGGRQSRQAVSADDHKGGGQSSFSLLLHNGAGNADRERGSSSSVAEPAAPIDAITSTLAESSALPTLASGDVALAAVTRPAVAADPASPCPSNFSSAAATPEPPPAAVSQAQPAEPNLLNAMLAYTALIGGGTFLIRTVYPIDSVMSLGLTYVKPARQLQYLGAFALGVWAARSRRQLVRPAEEERRLKWTAGTSLLALIYGISLVQDKPGVVRQLTGGWHWPSLGYSFVETGVSLATTVAAISVAERMDRQRRAAQERRSALANRLSRDAYGVYILHYFVITMLQTGLERVRPQWPALLKWISVTSLGLPLSYVASDLCRRLPGASYIL